LQYRHLVGLFNRAADTLSCNALPSIQKFVPGASSWNPVALPRAIQQCLVPIGHRPTGLFSFVVLCEGQSTCLWMAAVQVLLRPWDAKDGGPFATLQFPSQVSHHQYVKICLCREACHARVCMLPARSSQLNSKLLPPGLSLNSLY